MLINSHINHILEIPNIQKGGPVPIREFVSKVKQQIGALKNLNQPVNHWDMILISVLSKKLDAFTNRAFQIDRDTSKLPTLTEFLEYLETRATALETAGGTSRGVNTFYSNHVQLEKNEYSCVFCKPSGHKLYNCRKFKTLSVNNRISFVDKNKICRMCLNSHIGKCKSKFRCQVCHKEHNSLLYLDKSSLQVNTLKLTQGFIANS